MKRIRTKSKFQDAWNKYKKENPNRETNSLYVNENKSEIVFLDNHMVVTLYPNGKYIKQAV